MDLPEYILKASQFSERLSGLQIEGMTAFKDEYLNMPKNIFENNIKGAYVLYVKTCGKWVSIALSTGKSIMINPGVGGDINLFDECENDRRTHVITLKFSDGCALKSEMKLFGKFYLASENELLKSKFCFDLEKLIPKTSLSYIFKRTVRKNQSK